MEPKKRRIDFDHYADSTPASMGGGSPQPATVPAGASPQPEGARAPAPSQGLALGSTLGHGPATAPTGASPQPGRPKLPARKSKPFAQAPIAYETLKKYVGLALVAAAISTGRVTHAFRHGGALLLLALG